MRFPLRLFIRGRSALPGIKPKRTRRTRRGSASLSAFASASLTVEAACVLPLFLFIILLFFELIRAADTAGRVAAGLQEAGEQMAVYACVSDSQAGEERSKAEHILSLAYAAKCIREHGGNQALAVSLASSSIREGDEIIDLTAEYRLRWHVPFLPSQSMKLVQRVRVRAWTGREETSGSGEDGDGIEVYITESGTVYHRDRECRHLRLSVHQVTREALQRLRSEDGSKYYPCEDCGGGSGAVVYITDTGNRYHSSVSCSALKRTVITVPLSELTGWRSCAVCGG